MKIGIIGTRGIPNHYGGFEQFAEYLATYLVKKQCKVYVYNSSNHPYQEKKFKGVHIIHCYDPEDKIGSIGQFIYDYNCIIDSKKRNLDIILQLGYTSSSIWSFLFPKKVKIITNMDGLEWKRSKYGVLTKKFLKYAEKLAVKKSHYLISDSIGIQNYIYNKYNLNSEFIAYGTEIFEEPNEEELLNYNLTKFKYNLLIARIEPENSIKEIIEGSLISKSKEPLVVIGDYKRNNFGLNLYEKYKNKERVIFLGSIYNKNILNNLRFFSNLYFHGHTVGGTNPSLLEAMATECFIIANRNEFNFSVLGEDAYYFETPKDIANHINNIKKEEKTISNNLVKVKKHYNINEINNSYLNFFYKALQ